MNKRKRNTLAIVGALVLVAICWLVFQPKTNDSDQIKVALLSAVKASKEGRAGGVVEYLASNVQVNGQKYDVNRQFTSFIRQYHPDITLGSLEPKINGDHATLTTDLQISILKNTATLPGVTFTFEKEHDTKWLIFPSQDWKVTGASAPDEAYQQFIGQIPGGDFGGGGLW